MTNGNVRAGDSFGRRGPVRRPGNARPDAEPGPALSEVTPRQIILSLPTATTLAFAIAVSLCVGFLAGRASVDAGVGRLASSNRGEAVQRTSPDAVSRDAAAGHPDGDRELKSATTFFRFYLLNARARLEHCAAQGVEIKTFANTFARKFSRQHERAIALAVRHKSTKEKIWREMQPQLMSAIDSDMAEIEHAAGASRQDACRLVDEKAEMIVNQLDFEQQDAEANALLMAK